MDNPRCICGHPRSKHRGDGCGGAYATVAKSQEKSVEVPCPCPVFREVDEDYHEVRREGRDG